MTINIYTDGAFRPSLSKEIAGYGFVIHYNNEIYHFSGSTKKFIESRNIAGECLAVIEAIGYCFEQGLTGDIVVYHDYEGLGKWFTGEYQAKTSIAIDYVKNLQIYDALLRSINNDFSKPAFRFEWVRGHSGNEFNELADELAEQGLMKAIEQGE